MSMLKSLFGPKKDEVWKQLSQEIGGKFVQGETLKGGKVIAKVDEWTVTLDLYRTSSSHHDITYTRLRAPYINKDGFRFRIYKAGLFSTLEKLFGLQDIKVGSPVLDDHYIVQGNDEAKVKALFFSKRICRLIDVLPSIYLEVRDDDGWFSDTFPEGVDELYCLVEGEIANIDQLKTLYNLFAEVLHHLCHLGSAYENDPELEL